MATIRQRKNSKGLAAYHVQIRLKGFPTETASFERLTDARRWAQATEAAMQEGRYFKAAVSKQKTLAEAIQHGIPDHIRSDNGSEFTAKPIKAWLTGLGVKTLYIEPGSPWENGYNESFNGRFRDEFLKTEAFYTLKEAEVLTAQWRYLYNHIRPHSSLGYKPPAPLAKMAAPAGAAIIKSGSITPIKGGLHFGG